MKINEKEGGIDPSLKIQINVLELDDWNLIADGVSPDLDPINMLVNKKLNT